MSIRPIRVIITGATGMVGEGVMHTCLANPDVTKVLVINRKPCGVTHPKLEEVIHRDFYDLSPIAHLLQGYDACFFCLGVSSVGMDEAEYYRSTYTLTMHVADTLSHLNPQMTFHYVSGAGTDGTEQGRSRWARVKGKTENDLRKLPFKRAYAYRPGFIKPMPGMLRTHAFYRYINWLFPIGRMLFPGAFCTLKELSLAMIRAAILGYEKEVLEGKDIIQLGRS